MSYCPEKKKKAEKLAERAIAAFLAIFVLVLIWIVSFAFAAVLRILAFVVAK